MTENGNIAAAVYIGAYTLQMLIAKIVPGQDPVTINEYTAYTQAAAGTDPSVCSAEGLALVEKALAEMHKIAREEGVTEYRLAASNTIRNLSNRSTLLLIFRKEFGVFPQLLGTLDEARLHFIGASPQGMEDLPLLVVYLGYNSIPAACGKSGIMDKIMNQSFGVGLLNGKFQTNSTVCGFFKRMSIQLTLKKELAAFSREVREWKDAQKIPPELVMVGPFPITYVSIEQKKKIVDFKAIASAPHSLSKLCELTRKISLMSPAQRMEMPYIDRDMAETLTACMFLQTAIVQACGMTEFRVSANGLCTGLLKVPADIAATAVE